MTAQGIELMLVLLSSHATVATAGVIVDRFIFMEGDDE